MKLILLGPPGAGKGTQAEILSKHFAIPAISTGNILRAAVKNGTPVGRKAKEFMDAGKLVPDEVIIGVITERLAEADCAKGFILDGVPRTIAQAEALDAAGVAFDRVVSLEITDAEIVSRMSGRRVCTSCGAPYHITGKPTKVEGVCDSCGGSVQQRSDDKPEVVLDRLAVYHKETAPLEAYYRRKGNLVAVGNQETPEATFQAVLAVLEQ
ncbi:adenylate kinase [bioreactor metagenome]|uniref:Adenylate kinase n=1 Tax=bioreactor metagenome TaxID=1076179 RepID=A0A645BGZ8_9ZZZZ